MSVFGGCSTKFLDLARIGSRAFNNRLPSVEGRNTLEVTIMGNHNLEKSCCIAIITLSLSTLTSGLIPSANAQTFQTNTTATNSRSSVDLLNRGRDRFQHGDYKGAIEDFNQVIVLNPNNASAYYNRGLVLHELGDDLNAVGNFDRALQLNPRDGFAYLHRAGARYGLGDQPGTIQDLQLAAQLFKAQGDTKNYQLAENLIRRLHLPI